MRITKASSEPSSCGITSSPPIDPELSSRRRDVVGVFPNDASLIRLAGMLLIEQNDEWLVSRRYLSQESLAALSTRETELSATAVQETEQQC